MKAHAQPSLETTLDGLAGAGPARVAALAAIGIRTVRDLLLHLPRRMRTRPRECTIARAVRDAESTGASRVVIVGTIRSARSGRGRSPARFIVEDASGSLEAVVFGLRQIPRALRRGNSIQLEGRVAFAMGRCTLFADHYAAQEDFRADGSPEPIYELPDTVPPRTHARWIRALLPLAENLGDELDVAQRERAAMPSIARAVAIAHAPPSEADYEPARRRFAFEELRDLVAPLRARRRALESFDKRRRLDADSTALLARLSFTPTGDQRAALAAILADLARPAPMHRLLHGEVGSGKTCVALLALFAVVRAGYVAALLAPTAVLARQHAAVARALFAPARVRVVELTRETPTAEARLAAEAMRDGEPTLVVGTLRMLGSLPEIAFAVIDEQQRFGVSQRARLRADPGTDLLVMTATPIPRTLALVAYGDLDLTTLRESPPGRRRVDTRVVATDAEVAPFAEIIAEVRAGGRVYVICPQIDGESFRSVERIAKRLRGELGRAAVAVAHGRLPDAAAVAALDAFRAGSASILVSTVLVEVGIDVPEATLITVLDAERFGLSQLHQLRGRVGRGERPGRCLLVTSCTAETAGARLRALVRAESGFAVAEADLELRGAGRLLGAEQHGDIELRYASLVRDVDLLALAAEPGADSRLSVLPRHPDSDRNALLAYGPG